MSKPMYLFPALALATALATVPVLPGSASAAEVRRITEKTFDFKPGGEMAIDNQNGRIVVEAWDQPRARIQVTRISRASDPQKAEEYMKQIQSEVTITTDKIEIKSHYPKRQESMGIWAVLVEKSTSFQTHYYVQVPVRTRLDLETSNGEIRVRGTQGACTAQSTNGSIGVSGANGALLASTTNGSVEVEDTSGSLEATTTNGSITAVFRTLDPKGSLHATTTNGNVEIYLPKDVKATVEAGTTNGSIRVSFPLTSSGIMTSKTVRGTIGGGGSTVALTTTNGQIRVARLEEYDSH
jgi:putative adhesin